MFLPRGSNRSRSVVTLISKHLQFKCLKEVGDSAGRFLFLLSEIQGWTMILANVYAPNVDDPAFFGKLESTLNDFGNYPVIMGGDFNLVLHHILDRNPPASHINRLARALQDICKDSGMVDVWQLLNPSTRDYTFNSSPHGTLSRLDFFLISNSVTSSAVSSTIGNIQISDHAPVFLGMLPFNKTASSPR